MARRASAAPLAPALLAAADGAQHGGRAAMPGESGQPELDGNSPGWLGYVGDEKLPSYMGIIINHYKDPYKTTRIHVDVSENSRFSPLQSSIFIGFSII